MKLIENRIEDSNLHKDILNSHLFPSVHGGKLYAAIYLPEWLGKDKRNVCVYDYPIGEIVQFFIDMYIYPQTGKMNHVDAKKAKVIIADLESMIKKLRCAIP